MTEDRKITLDHGITLEMVIDGGEFKGINRVEWHGKPLRREGEFIVPQIVTPDGWEMASCEWIGMRREGDSVILMTRPRFRPAFRMDWTEHALHPRIPTASWSGEGETIPLFRLEWRIRPSERRIHGTVYRGFSYGFRYHCPGKAIYQLLDRASWELDGDANTNTFILRNGFHSPVIPLKKNERFYSGWDLPGIANPNVFQFLPLYTQLQGFTFQMNDDDELITVHERPSHVRSLFQKEAGRSRLIHFHQFCFDLTDTVETPERHVWIGSRRHKDETAQMNHFLRVRDTLQTEIRDDYGIHTDRVRPSAHVETWDVARMDQFPAIFEKLESWGIHRIFLMPLWRSNETDIIPRFKVDRERFGVMGNMCCPLELEIADCYGGWDGLRQVMKPAADRGMEIYTWFGSHFSSMSPLERKIPDLFARDVSGQYQRNNYGHVLLAVNQNSEAYQAYLIDRFRLAKECGIRGVFRDSHFNMASDTIHFTHTEDETIGGGVTPDRIGFLDGSAKAGVPVIRTMHDTEIEIQRRFQKELGLLYYVESLGMIGTPMGGTDYEYTRGHEYLFSDVESGMNAERVRACGDDPYTAYFRGLSCRMIYQLNVEVNRYPDKGSIDEWWDEDLWVPLLQAYKRVENDMDELWLLEEGRGIRWCSEDGKTEVIFAYQDFTHVPERKVVAEDVIAAETVAAVDGKGGLPLRALRIYRLVPAEA